MSESLKKITKIVFVCGSFDSQGGKRSTIGHLLHTGFSSTASVVHESHNLYYVNGGHTDELEVAYHRASKAQIVVWFPNVPNDHPKNLVRSLKVVNPTCVLVTSKRVVEKDYSFPAIIQHALALHSNLVVVFNKHLERSHHYEASLIDPLGNLYSHAASHNEMIELGANLRTRVDYLCSLQRVMSQQALGHCLTETPKEDEFLDVVRDAAARFAELIPSPTPVTRFVGNAAFRCSHGFPAVRGKDSTFYVSRRNVDKTIASMEDFVPVVGKTGNVLLFYGQYKPSVDAPIQAGLFELYPKIRYMLHGHVYVKGASSTVEVIPCGALNEVNEIWRLFPANEITEFVVNLRGHGFLAGADTPEKLARLHPHYIARPVPEDQRAWLEERSQQDRFGLILRADET